MPPGDLGRRIAGRADRSAAFSAQPRWHVARGHGTPAGQGRQGVSARYLPGLSQQSRQVDEVTLAPPGPHTFLQQPQSHHVAQEADRAVDAQFVAEVRRCGPPRSVTGRHSSTPTSDQVPQEMYAKFSRRAGTPATADAVSCEPTRDTARCTADLPQIRR